MEKRLLLALFLTTLVLVVWQAFKPKAQPRPAPPPVAERREGEPTAPVAAQEEAEIRPAVGPVERAEEARELELTVGEPGQPGSYHARFTNRGARLVELRLGDSYDRPRLSAEEQRSIEHWTRLLEPAETPEGETGSLVLSAEGDSSRDLAREPLESALWSMRELPASEGWPGVEFALAPGSGVRFVKRVRFEPGVHRLHVDLVLENLAHDKPSEAYFLFTPAAVVPPESGDRYYYEPQAVAAGRSAEGALDPARNPPEAESVARDLDGSSRGRDFDVYQAALAFAGVHNKYFAVLMRGANPAAAAAMSSAKWRAVYDSELAREHPRQAADAWRFIATDVRLKLAVPEAGKSATWSYVVYAGPKQRDALLGDCADHEVLLEKDVASIIPLAETTAHVLVVVLRALESVTGNWGVAIILMTFLVRLILFPINRRSQTQMARYGKRMKRVQPQIDELKKRFANDPAKLQKAQAELMQKEGLFPPLGGCLPLFIQLPVFIGLFSALRTNFELRQAPFLAWMIDLSKPDRLLELGWNTHLPLIGTIEYLNLLPLLMVVLSLIQQKTLPTPVDEKAAQMQKMMMFFPVVMCLIFYDYAAGLSLYMITQSVLGILEQTVIKKIWPVDDSEPDPKQARSPGFFGRLQQRAVEMQKSQEERRRRLAAAGRGKSKRR